MDDEIVYKYQVLQVPMYKIAKELGIAVGTVYNVCKRAGVETRPSRNGYMKGKHHTEQAKSKISVAHKGKIVSDETRCKMSESKRIHQSGHRKKRPDGYIHLYFPDYLGSSADGYVMEHVYLMEQHLGRKLNDNEVVHHINKIRDDNRIENLMVMTKSEHTSMHTKERHANKK